MSYLTLLDNDDLPPTCPDHPEHEGCPIGCPSIPRIAAEGKRWLARQAMTRRGARLNAGERVTQEAWDLGVTMARAQALELVPTEVLPVPAGRRM